MKDIKLGLPLEHTVPAYLRVKTGVENLSAIHLFSLNAVEPESIKLPVGDFYPVYIRFPECERFSEFLLSFMIKLDGNAYFINVTNE